MPLFFGVHNVWAMRGRRVRNQITRKAQTIHWYLLSHLRLDCANSRVEVGVVSGVVRALITYLKLKNRSCKQNGKRDRIRVRRIRTFPFLLTPLMTLSLTFCLWPGENQIVGVRSRSRKINQSPGTFPRFVIGLVFSLRMAFFKTSMDWPLTLTTQLSTLYFKTFKQPWSWQQFSPAARYFWHPCIITTLNCHTQPLCWKNQLPLPLSKCIAKGVNPWFRSKNAQSFLVCFSAK